jgi:DNA topoisomerase-1
MSKLVIVESPGKIKKIQSILGDEYLIAASVGHIIDLDPSSMSINFDNYFEPVYMINKDKQDVVKNLKNLYKKTKEIYIATDKDREGEMIGWSIAHVLKLDDPKRIAFGEITQTELLNAINNPKKLDINYINSQKARRILDRIIGYKISPILWKNVNAKSAGRVQSVVVKLIIERENEIKKFFESDISSFFNIDASFNNNICAYLAETDKTSKVRIFKYDEAIEIMKNIKQSSGGKVSSVVASDAISNPPCPFTTSTLQQEAFNRCGMNSKRCMMAAQYLYEAGHITYMRTDSMNLSEEALNEIKKFVTKKYGKEYSCLKKYAVKGNTQEAHEAIRPTKIKNESVVKNGNITDDAVKLYSLIWKRTIASQMACAKYDVQTISIKMDKILEYHFVSQNKIIKFNGYLAAYGKNCDESQESEGSEGEHNVIKKDAKLELKSAIAQQSYEKPPSRYNEASLIKRLDPSDLNIGRPSTYASTINGIQEKGYVKLENFEGIVKETLSILLENNKITEKKGIIMLSKETNKLCPTQLGITVNDYLEKHFDKILDYSFTANIEKDLDDIASGDEIWHSMVKKIYDYINPIVIDLEKNYKKVSKEFSENPNMKLIGEHPTEKYLVYGSVGKYGPYLTYTVGKKAITAPIKSPFNLKKITIEEAVEILKYPKHISKIGKKNVVLKKGKYGFYLNFGKENIAITDKKEEELTFECVKNIIDENSSKKLFCEKSENKTYTVKKGPHGLYVEIKDGKKVTNKKIPEETVIKEMTIDKLKEIIKTSQKKTYRKVCKKIE